VLQALPALLKLAALGPSRGPPVAARRSKNYSQAAPR
jgi:hypothetical protein